MNFIVFISVGFPITFRTWSVRCMFYVALGREKGRYNKEK